MLLLLFCLVGSAVSESMIYLHPSNPKLHKSQQFPQQKTMRGFQKIRDLPSSGLIYLNKIKSIDEEFAKARDDETFVKKPQSGPLEEIASGKSSENIDYSVYDDIDHKESSINPTTTTHSAPNDKSIDKIDNPTLVDDVTELLPAHQPSVNTRIAKNNGKQDSDLSNESEQNLNKLIDEVIQFEDNKKITFKTDPMKWLVPEGKENAKNFDSTAIKLPGQRRLKAKEISLTGTARIHSGFVKHPGVSNINFHKKNHALKQVPLSDAERVRPIHRAARKPTKFKAALKKNNPVNFDPWERIGQRA